MHVMQSNLFCIIDSTCLSRGSSTLALYSGTVLTENPEDVIDNPSQFSAFCVLFCSSLDAICAIHLTWNHLWTS